MINRKREDIVKGQNPGGAGGARDGATSLPVHVRSPHRLAQAWQAANDKARELNWIV